MDDYLDKYRIDFGYGKWRKGKERQHHKLDKKIHHHKLASGKTWIPTITTSKRSRAQKAG
jgi:hypothetical protein